MAIVYLGLGANLGDREANIGKALDYLKEHGVDVLKVSRLVETEPQGGPSQPEFLNGAARIRTDLAPEPLLDLLQAAETAVGRQKTGVRWGPREVDLDILLYDDRIVRTPRLTVPHPLMLDREFVLAPLAEIAPKAVHPERERTIRQLFVDLDDEKHGRHRVRLARTLEELSDYVDMAKRNRFTIGLVPTMGAFHEGHRALMRAARSVCDLVIVSLFVNPAQFGPDEDLESYPRRLDSDLRKAAEEKVDLVFAPEAEAMYPEGPPTFVTVEEVTDRWCGSSRPGHFRGVTTVVAKLFHLVRPDLAFFGQKDYQQSVAIRRMVADLFFPVEIRVLPTVREEDGLAMSSRNSYLKAEDRERATCLWRGMTAARQAFDAGERTTETLVSKIRDVIEATEEVEPEYVAIVDPDSLEPIPEIEDRAVILVAVRLGGTRLIDNLVLGEE